MDKYFKDGMDVEDARTGMKVKCIHGYQNLTTSSAYSLNEGKVYTLKTVEKQYNVVTVEESKGTWDVGRFLPADTELDRLIAVADAGMKARNELRNRFSGQAEEVTGNGQASPILNDDSTYNTSMSVRKRAFEKRFKIANYDVVATPVNTQVGCKMFDTKNLVLALSHLVIGHKPMAAIGTHGPILYATKPGIQCDGNFLDWKDVEELYNQIKDIK